MKRYPWLYLHFKKIIDSYQSGRGHHALLIQVLPGMGDNHLIYAIARCLMCQKKKKYKSCGICQNCQLMEAGTHPDYHILSLNESENTIGIDSIREINEKLYKRAKFDTEKIVWLTDTDLLTESAANALLKALEEPIEKTKFFLSCYEPKRLLATLRSRCRKYYLSAPQESWSLVWLNRENAIPQDKAITALRLYNGAPAAALAMIRSIKYSQRECLCTLMKEALESRNWLLLLKFLNQNQATEYLYWMISLFLDALKVQYGITLITNIDNKVLVTMLSSNFSDRNLLTIIHDICDCRQKLLIIKNINRELILANQLLHIECSYYHKDN